MAEQLPFDPTGWNQDATGAWTRTSGGLLLRAWRDPDGSNEPWTWEVLLVSDAEEYEIGLGGAETLGVAMVRAEITGEEPPFDPAAPFRPRLTGGWRCAAVASGCATSWSGC